MKRPIPTFWLASVFLAGAAVLPSCIFVSSKETKVVEGRAHAGDDFRTVGRWIEETTFDAGRAGSDAAAREFALGMSARDADDAARHFEKSLDACPSAAAFNNLGCIHLAAGRRVAARATFMAALALEPGNEAAEENLAEVLDD